MSARGMSSSGRNKTRVVTFRVPHNAAVQIYDYKEKTARYINQLSTNLTQVMLYHLLLTAHYSK